MSYIYIFPNVNYILAIQYMKPLILLHHILSYVYLFACHGILCEFVFNKHHEYALGTPWVYTWGQCQITCWLSKPYGYLLLAMCYDGCIVICGNCNYPI